MNNNIMINNLITKIKCFIKTKFKHIYRIIRIACDGFIILFVILSSLIITSIVIVIVYCVLIGLGKVSYN